MNQPIFTVEELRKSMETAAQRGFWIGLICGFFIGIFILKIGQLFTWLLS